MKKYTRVLSLVVIAIAALGFSGCSSTKLASSETTEMPVESNAGGEAFNNLASADLTPTADPGAVVDTAPPSTVVASADPAPAYSAPSPVNLGASSAGRAH